MRDVHGVEPLACSYSGPISLDLTAATDMVYIQTRDGLTRQTGGVPPE